MKEGIEIRKAAKRLKNIFLRKCYVFGGIKNQKYNQLRKHTTIQTFLRSIETGNTSLWRKQSEIGFEIMQNNLSILKFCHSSVRFQSMISQSLSLGNTTLGRMKFEINETEFIQKCDRNRRQGIHSKRPVSSIIGKLVKLQSSDTQTQLKE